jgi:hypothetical protein
MSNRQPIGCAVIATGINFTLMGLLALSFSRGPYSSLQQEHWYRFGSLAFLLAGAILPAVALILGAGRSTLLRYALYLWLLAAILAWCYYVFMSSGGV